MSKYESCNEGKPVQGYKDLVDELLERFPVGEQTIGESAQKEFIKLYDGSM